MKLFKSPHFKPFSKQIFHIALPVALSNIIMQVQILIDTAFLARYSTTVNGTALSGSDILSAVGNVFFPYMVTISFIWALGTGVVVLVSQHLGAEKPNEALKVSNVALKYNTLLSWIGFAFWFFFAKNVFTIMGVQEPILTLSLQYIGFVSLELLYLGTSTSVNAIFQGSGNTQPEMYAGIFRSLLHILLDYLFIFGHFGFPEMGVIGAGIASSTSGFISTLIMILILAKSKTTPFKVDIKSVILAPIRPYIKLLRTALPASLEEMLWNFGNLVLAYFLNLLSPDAVGIYRLVYQIEITPCYFYMGIARAVTTLVGQSTGARDLASARESGLIGTFYSICSCIIFTASFILIPRLILSIFTPDLQLIDEATPLLIITAFTMMPRAVNIISGNGIRGYGDTLWMLATQIFGIVFVLILAYILMFPVGLGIYGLFISMFSDETVRCIINSVRFYRGETSIFHKAPLLEKSVVETA